MDILAYLGPRELILYLIQRNLSLLPYSCKQSPWEQCLLLWWTFFRKALPCLTQELEGPVPGQGWQQGLVTQCQPWRLVLREKALCSPVLDAKHCSDGLCHHWHHEDSAGPERKPDPASPALYFSRESSEREERGRCYTRACWNEFLRSDMNHPRAWWSLCYLSLLLRTYTCIFLTT